MPDSPQADSDPLAYLISILGAPPSRAGAPAALTDADWGFWKTRAEELGHSQHLESAAVADTLVKVAELGGKPHYLAYAYWISGNMHHNRRAMNAAHAAYRAGAQLYNELGDQLNLARMSVGWVNVLTERGDLDAALDLAQMVEQELQQSGDPADDRRLAILYGSRGIAHECAGHLVAAQADYERKWQYYRSQPDTDLASRMEGAMALNDLAVVHALLGQHVEADRLLHLALQRLEPCVADPAAQADRTLLLMNCAWVATLRQSPYSVVRRAFEKARAGRDQLRNPLDQLYCAHIELDEANWLIRHGYWREVARGRLVDLQARLAEHGIEFESIYAALLLGQLDVLGGAADAAYFARLAEVSLEKMPALAYLAYLWQARALRGQDAAEAVLRQAIDLIEQARGRLTLDDYRAGYLEDKLVAYQDLLALYLDRSDYPAAWAVSERSKARTLAEAAGAADIVSPAHASSGSWTVASLAEQLAPGMLAISYAEVHDDLWAFLADCGGLVGEPVHLGRRLDRSALENGLHKIQQIAGLDFAALDTGGTARLIEAAQVPLGIWYAAYLAPLRPWLEHYTQLVIAPDGLLNALPFACLFDIERGQYLVQTHTVTLAPSLALWPVLNARLAQAQSESGYRALVVGSSSLDGQFSVLPGTIREAHAIAALFADATLLIDGQATVDAFMHHAKQSWLIYVAAHGIQYPGDPAASYVELAGEPLRVREILGMHLPHSLVVLSACDTGRGHLVGNELMGIVRGFLYAGASAVLSNHWQVEDEAALRLMTKVMQLLAVGNPLAAALQQAQQDWIGQASYFAHPFFWGAPCITGAGLMSPSTKEP